MKAEKFSFIFILCCSIVLADKCDDIINHSPLVEAIKSGESNPQKGTPYSSNYDASNREYRKDNGKIGYAYTNFKPTEMTLNEILDKMKDKKVLHAVGAAQFVNKTQAPTFSDMVSYMQKNYGIDPSKQKFDQAFQDRLWNDYFFKKKKSTIGKYLTCGTQDQCAAVDALAQEWASIGSCSKNGAGWYNNGIDQVHTSYDTIKRALEATKANLAKEGCITEGANCKIDENATIPENSSSSPKLDYTRTDTTFQSSKRQLKAQYKYERANNCYYNALCA